MSREQVGKSSKDNMATVNYSSPENLVKEFASRGLVILAPETLGISSEVHKRLFAQEKQLFEAKQAVTPANTPAILEVINSPGLVAACNQLVGENWAIVPFTHNAPFASGPRDQHWHKDDNGPYNSRKQRHHQVVQIEMIYYPQLVTPEMGPTATIPYSQYWTFNHEENHDNFAGADHLDFDYVLSGMERVPVSGPDSKYSRDDIVQRSTAHDIRMRDAVTKTGWPLVQPLEAAPLRAGSVILYSHNTFHRGNHRRDDWQTWADNPRFMWRFFIYRTSDVARVTVQPVPELGWRNLGKDELTGIELDNVSDDVTTVWRYHYHWMLTGEAPPDRPETGTLDSEKLAQEADRLFNQLLTKSDEAEPARIGAAYKLASLGDSSLAIQKLGEALYNDRESVRRAATYGLTAVGPAATKLFLKAAKSESKWVRKAAIYGLGDASPLTEAVLTTVVASLESDPSVYVRSVAAGTLGCLGRRAIASGIGIELIPACFKALLQSLNREENRLGMSQAQGRSIKFVRPTDDSDVCEGDGVDFGLDRFEPVRSAVRENVLWAMVILCSHGAAVLDDTLEPTMSMLERLIREDKNVVTVGYAMDALARLVNIPDPEALSVTSIEDAQAYLLAVLNSSPIQCWESLVRTGLNMP